MTYHLATFYEFASIYRLNDLSLGCHCEEPLRQRSATVLEYDDGADVAARKLPLWQTLLLTFAGYFLGFKDVLRITWFWILLMVVIIGAANAFKWSWAAWIFERYKAGDLQYVGVYPIISMALYMVIVLLLALASVDVAVAWHRLILRSEPLGWPGSCFAANRGWQYLGLSLLLSFVAALPVVIILTAASTDLDSYFPEFEMSPFWDAVIGAGIALAALVTGPAMFMRLAPVLSARAVDDTGLTLLRCWKVTRGSTWRLLVGGGCVAVIPSLFAQFVHLVLGTDPLQQRLDGLFEKAAFPGGEWREAASLQLAAALGLLAIPFIAGFLSHTYRHFVRRLPGGGSVD